MNFCFNFSSISIGFRRKDEAELEREIKKKIDLREANILANQFRYSLNDLELRNFTLAIRGFLQAKLAANVNWHFGHLPQGKMKIFQTNLVNNRICRDKKIGKGG